MAYLVQAFQDLQQDHGYVFYVQAAAGNTAKSVTSFPPSQHNVFIYTVAQIASSDSSIVINEVMATNASAVADNAGEFDDWIKFITNRILRTTLAVTFIGQVC